MKTKHSIYSVFFGVLFLAGACGPVSAAIINGAVINDLNTNGMYDVGEPGISYFIGSIDLYQYENSVSNYVEYTTVDINGYFTFNVLDFSTYFLRLYIPEGWLFSGESVSHVNYDEGYGDTSPIFCNQNDIFQINVLVYQDPDSNSAPVPEPSTIVLMGLGLVGLAGLGRKRMKR